MKTRNTWKIRPTRLNWGNLMKCMIAQNVIFSLCLAKLVCVIHIQCFCFPYIVIAQTTRYLLNFPFTTRLQFVFFTSLVACVSNVNPRCSLYYTKYELRRREYEGDSYWYYCNILFSIIVVVKHCFACFTIGR